MSESAIARVTLLLCASTVLAAIRVEAATCTWTGAAANANWNQAGNWSGCSVPATGDDLVFPDGAARLANSNNFTAPFALRSITFPGTTGGYVLSGNTISLSAGITSSNTSSTNRLSLTVTLAASQSIIASAAGGTLLLQHATAGQPALQISGFALTFTGAGTTTVAGTGSITTTGSIRQFGTGQTNLNAANAGFTGPVTVDNGTLSIGDVQALGTADGTAATGVTVNAGATLNVGVTGTVANKLVTLNGGPNGTNPATLSTTITNVVWSGPVAFTGTVDIRDCPGCAGQTTITGPITGNGTFRTGAASAASLGILVLSNSANSFTGETQITLSPTSTSAGTLRLGAGEVIPNGSAVTVSAPRRFDVNGQLETIGSLTGDGPVLLGTGGVLTVGGDNTTTTYAGIMTGAGAAKLIKVGSGAFTLSAANTHPLTVVQGGTVFVTGTSPAMAVTISGGSLGGTGRTGAVTATGGAISPGVGGTSVLATGNLTVSAPTAINVELNGTTVGTNYDQLDVTGTVALTNATLNVAVGFIPPPFSTFTIINNDGVDAVTGTFAGLPQGARLTAGGVSFSISYNGGTGNDVVLTSLPAAPTATSDQATTPFGTAVAVMPANNDSAGSGATLVVGSIDLDPAAPGQQTTRTVVGRGTFTLNTSTGQVSFVPDAAFSGIAAVDYTITDNLGQISNLATIAITVAAPIADVMISEIGTTSVIPGATAHVVYAITITNAGPRDASSVIVSNTTPPGLTFVSNTGACVMAFPCDLGTMTNGAVRTITATYAVGPGYAGASPIVHSVNVSTTTSSDPNLANNIASASTTVTPQADLALAVTGPAHAQAGADIDYTLVVTNIGPSDATTVAVTDPTPSGLTFVHNTGACQTAFPCQLGSIAPGETRTITATFTIPSNTTAPHTFVNAVDVSAATIDPTSSNNSATASTGLTSPTDVDGDGLADTCETRFGLDPASAAGDDGADGDPDHDGKTNAQECADGTHPRGLFKRYLAEGSTGSFFDTEIELLNPGDTPARVLLEYQLQVADPAHPHPSDFLIIPPNARRSINPAVTLGAASFSTVVESDVEIVVERTMKWDSRHYGSHAETSQPSPETTWYLAEGATHGTFNLFYLLQNPNDAAASVEITYLRPAPKPPIVKTYPIAAKSRLTIWVDAEGPEFEAEEFSAAFHADVPIVVERAMYIDTPDHTWAGGTDSAAVHLPSPQWFFAEGATGAFFDTFFLIANPNPSPITVRATYLLYTGQSFTKDYAIDANSRFTISAGSDDPRLASTAFSTSFQTVGGEGIVAERSMWWPATMPWIEGHNSTGLTTTGTMWAVAEGELDGPDHAETYVLVANTSIFDGTIRARALSEDGTTVTRTIVVTASSRFTISAREIFPEMTGKKFGVVLESIDPTPAQITAEVSIYLSADGVTWSAGSNAPATRLR